MPNPPAEKAADSSSSSFSSAPRQPASTSTTKFPGDILDSAKQQKLRPISRKIPADDIRKSDEAEDEFASSEDEDHLSSPHTAISERKQQSERNPLTSSKSLRLSRIRKGEKRRKYRSSRSSLAEFSIDKCPTDDETKASISRPSFLQRPHSRSAERSKISPFAKPMTKENVIKVDKSELSLSSDSFFPKKEKKSYLCDCSFQCCCIIAAVLLTLLFIGCFLLYWTLWSSSMIQIHVVDVVFEKSTIIASNSSLSMIANMQIQLSHHNNSTLTVPYIEVWDWLENGLVNLNDRPLGNGTSNLTLKIPPNNITQTVVKVRMLFDSKSDPDWWALRQMLKKCDANENIILKVRTMLKGKRVKNDVLVSQVEFLRLPCPLPVSC